MGKLYVVGIGPGDYDNMTIRAGKVLERSDLIIGYHVYVDLVKRWYPENTFLTTPMTREAERCRRALEEAEQGKQGALV